MHQASSPAKLSVILAFVILAALLPSPTTAKSISPTAKKQASVSANLIAEIAVKATIRRAVYRGKRVPMITSITVYGPGVKSSNVTLACDKCRRLLGKKVKRKRIRSNAVRFTRVNFLPYSAAASKLNDFRVAIRVVSGSRVGRWISLGFAKKVGQSRAIRPYRLSYSGAGCLVGEQSVDCPDSRPRLNSGETLPAGKYLKARAGAFEDVNGGESWLYLDPDGELKLVYRCAAGILGKPKWILWRSQTAGNPGARLVMQPDGDLQLLSADNRLLWQSGSSGNPGSALEVYINLFFFQSADFGIVNGAGQYVWSTAESTASAPGNCWI